MLLLNQALMMLWEAIQENASLVGILLLILLAAWGYWIVYGRHKKMLHRLALLLAAVIAVIGFFTLPMFFNATLGDMTYWVDWAFHLAMVIGVLVYAYIVVLPIATGLLGSNVTTKTAQ